MQPSAQHYSISTLLPLRTFQNERSMLDQVLRSRVLRRGAPASRGAGRRWHRRWRQASQRLPAPSLAMSCR